MAEQRGRYTLPIADYYRARDSRAFVTCRRCPARIWFVPIPNSRVPHPLDVASAIEDVDAGRVILTTHFALCPEADRFRRGSSTAPAPMRRRCPRPRCTEEIPAKLFACVGHWRELPKPIRDELVAAYRPGQEVDGWEGASARYRDAAAMATRHWAGVDELKSRKQQDLW